MQIKTILNRIEKQPGFIYEKCQLHEGKALTLDITLRPAAGSRPICSVCGNKAPGYDTLRQRSFEFVSLWGILVFFSTPPGGSTARAAVSKWKSCHGRGARTG